MHERYSLKTARVARKPKNYFMNCLKFVIPLLSTILIMSCTKNDLTIGALEGSKNSQFFETKILKENVEQLEIPIQPVFQTRLPSFHAITFHILQREYAHKFANGETTLFEGEYLERRLIELYPEKAFEGMYDQAKAEMAINIANYEEYLSKLRLYEVSNGMEPSIKDEEIYRPFTTLNDEINYLQMTEDEIEEFNRYEALATSEKPITREQLESLLNLRSGVIVYVAIGTAAAITGYSVWRVYQSRNRAENKASSLFPGLTDAGKIGDAFRHIYVSVLLRNYLTIVGAWAVMGTYEIVNPNDHARDTYMDYHNNAVGRYYEYWTFRGSYWGDYGDWEEWAENAMEWVDNLNNGVYMDWQLTNPDADTAEYEEDEVDDYKYIYYKL